MAEINVHDYDVALPPKSAEDVVKRELQVIGAGHDTLQSVFEIDVPLGQAGQPSVGITVLESANVRLELRDTDNAGNVSEPSVFLFDATDTVAPPEPGLLGVTHTGERVVEVPE